MLENFNDAAAEGCCHFSAIALSQHGTETRMGEEIGNLQTGDVIALGFYLELAACEGREESLGRDELRALKDQFFETFFEPHVFFASPAFGHDIAPSMSTFQKRNEAFQHDAKAIVVRIETPARVLSLVIQFVDGDGDHREFKRFQKFQKLIIERASRL